MYCAVYHDQTRAQHFQRVQAEARGKSWVSSFIALHLDFETRSLTKPEAHYFQPDSSWHAFVSAPNGVTNI